MAWFNVYGSFRQINQDLIAPSRVEATLQAKIESVEATLGNRIESVEAPCSSDGNWEAQS